MLAPDQYEDDYSMGQSGVIVPNSPIPQNHSFQEAEGQDWVMFYGIGAEVYTIMASHPTIISNPKIIVKDSSRAEIAASDTTGMGEEEAIFDWTCPEDGICYVGLTDSSPHFGANVRSS